VHSLRIRDAALAALAGLFAGSVAAKVATLQTLLRRYEATRWRSQRFGAPPEDPIDLLLYQIFMAAGAKVPSSRAQLHKVISSSLTHSNKTRAA
jgi:hypothetical protein